MPKQPKLLTKTDRYLLTMWANPSGVRHKDLPTKPSTSLSPGFSTRHSKTGELTGLYYSNDLVNRQWKVVAPLTNPRPSSFCYKWAGCWVAPKWWTKVGTKPNHHGGLYYLTSDGVQRLQDKGLI